MTTPRLGRDFRSGSGAALLACLAVSCGGGGSTGGGASPTITSVNVVCTPSKVQTGQNIQCSATVAGTGGYSSAVNWTVDSGTISSSGLYTAPATVPTSGKATITATSSQEPAISGTTGVAVIALTSISVSPAAASLLLNSSVQFAAVGLYSDGSAEDISSQVTWTSQSTAIASISSTGVVSGVSPGSTEIQAAVGAIQGSTSVTIGSQSTGFVLNPDLTDSLLMMYTNTDGSVLSYFGTRDSTGAPRSIGSIRAVLPDQSQELIQLDSESRLSLISLSSGAQFSLNWTSPTTADLAAISPDGTAQIVTSLTIPTTASESHAQQNRRASHSQRASASDASGSGSQASVLVTTCGVPEDQAQINFTVVGAFGGQSRLGQSIGAGTYIMNLPTGASGLDLATLGSATQQTFSTACQAIHQGLPPGDALPKLNDAMCAAITAFIDGGTGLVAVGESAVIYNACLISGIGLKALDASCNTADAIEATGAEVDFGNVSGLTVDVQAASTVKGLGPPVAETALNVSPNSSIQVPAITMECPGVSNVAVTPSSVSMGVGESTPLGAQVFSSSGNVIESSAYSVSWTSTDPDQTYVSLANETPIVVAGVPIGIPTESVKGIRPTPSSSPVVVTATEGHSSKTGTTQVTVNGGSFWQGIYSIDSCDEPEPDVGTSAGCGFVMFPPNGGFTKSGYLYFRSDDVEPGNMRWDYQVGGSDQIEVCSSETSTGPINNASSFVYQTYTDLIGSYLENNITFKVTSKTATTMGGTFTGNYQYPTTGDPVNGIYPASTGTVSGTWSAYPIGAPFPKCIVPASFDICAANNLAEPTNNGKGVTGSCTFVPPTNPAPAGEWLGYP